MIIQNERNNKNFQLICPKCSSPLLKKHGFYDRHIVDYIDSEVKETILQVQRYYCKSCGTTHALVDNNVIPYRIYTLNFIKNVLLDLLKNIPIDEICTKYQISFQLIYIWKKQLTDLLKLIKQVKNHDSLLHLIRDLNELAIPFVKHFRFGLFQIKRKHLDKFYLGVCSTIAAT